MYWCILSTANLFCTSNYLNGHVNGKKKVVPTGNPHLFDELKKKLSEVHYQQFLDKNFRQFLIILVTHLQRR